MLSALITIYFEECAIPIRLTFFKNKLIYDKFQNLYGYAMSEKIPVDGFKWLDAADWTRDRIMGLNPNGKKGYIFEVDLQIPVFKRDSFLKRNGCCQLF